MCGQLNTAATETWLMGRLRPSQPLHFSAVAHREGGGVWGVQTPPEILKISVKSSIA